MSEEQKFYKRRNPMMTDWILIYEGDDLRIRINVLDYSSDDIANAYADAVLEFFNKRPQKA